MNNVEMTPTAVYPEIPRSHSTLAATHSAERPLLVTLSGTLILTDLLTELCLRLVKKNPLYALMLAVWAFRGRSVLASQLSRRVELQPAALPYNPQLLQWLRSEASAGRPLWLCTATHQKLAIGIASHLGLFDGVLPIDDPLAQPTHSEGTQTNKHLGEHGFDYFEKRGRDILVCRHACGVADVRGGHSSNDLAAGRGGVPQNFSVRTEYVKLVLKAVRPHQWTKNLLVFMPLLAAHRLTDIAGVLQALLAIAAFSLCASSVYVSNDLLDLEFDRAHERKVSRPFASGQLPLAAGLYLAPSLLCAAMLISTVLPPSFQVSLGVYYCVTIAYSFLLKRFFLIDALALASLYTLRMVAGAAAVRTSISFWMLLFSVFLFFSLALVKRFTELDSLRRQQRSRAAGRGYSVEDLPVLLSLGTASGYASVLVLALYIHSPEIELRYSRPQVIWILCLIMLYWMGRIWLLTQRGQMHDDPVVFALKDRTSLVLGALTAVTIACAI